jgi:hypothetical protein
MCGGSDTAISGAQQDWQTISSEHGHTITRMHQTGGIGLAPAQAVTASSHGNGAGAMNLI